MWAWLEPHDQYWRRVSAKMHSHLHTKDNKGKLDPGHMMSYSGVKHTHPGYIRVATGLACLQVLS
jgi:hypothetical protein